MRAHPETVFPEAVTNSSNILSNLLPGYDKKNHQKPTLTRLWMKPALGMNRLKNERFVGLRV
jgi:hypothetical protein